MRVRACLLALILFAGPADPALAAPPAGAVPAHVPSPLAAHRALYKLTLASTRGSRQISAAYGTMGFEVADVCDGWATRQRLRMVLTSVEGQETETDSDYVTWESRDGLSFRFQLVQKSDSAITTQTGGSARLSRAGGPGEAVFRVPRDNKIPLPAGTLFPMMHTAAIIAAAREGKKFVALPLFDGTDDAGIEDSAVALLDWKPPFPTKHAILSPLPSTRVRIGFFDRASRADTPSYEVGMRYWENGVADDMSMDFGDFVMNAAITDLTPLPRRC